MAYEEGHQDAALLLSTVRRTADFSGRSRRTEVIYYWIATALVQVTITFISMTLLSPVPHIIVASLIGILFLIPQIALQWRRLHDLNRSGWWSLIFIAILLTGTLSDVSAIESASGEPVAPGPLYWAWFAFCLLWIVIMLWPGTDGPNAYGEDSRRKPYD